MSGVLSQVDVCGREVAYRRAGSGEPLVLLHGFLCDSRVWRRQLAELGDEFDVVAGDAPGAGRSPDPPDRFALSESRAVEVPDDRCHLLDHVRRHRLGEARSLAESDTTDFLPSIDVPTLLLWGDGDRRSPLDVAAAFGTAVPGAELRVIENAGHVSNMERPDEFTAHVRHFARSN